MRKLIALLILILMFTVATPITVPATTAFSDTVEFRLNREQEYLTISAVTSSYRSNVPITIMLLSPPDNGITTIDSSELERNNAFNARLASIIAEPSLVDSVIANICEVKTENKNDKNGVFTYGFKIAGDGGLYRLIIKTNDGDTYTKDFYFFPQTYYEAIVYNVNNAKSPIDNDNYSVKYYLEKEIKLQDIFYDLYKNKLIDNGVPTDRIYKEIYNRKKEKAFSSYNELESFVKRQIAKTALYSGNSSVFDAVLADRTYTDILNLTWKIENIDGEIKSLTNFKDSTKTNADDKKNIIEYLSHSTGDSDFEFAAAVFMNKYSELTLWSQIKPCLASYYDNVLGLKYEEYTKLTDTETVDKALIGGTDVITYNRFENFKDAFEKALSNKDSSGDNGKPGNSFEGNSGGGGSGGSGSNILVSNQNVKEAANSSIVFYDLDNTKWAKEAIYALAKKNIVSGTGNGCFNPEDYVTREQFLTMIVRLYGLQSVNDGVDFIDTKSAEWYYPYVVAGVDNGVINGIGNGMFGIGTYISRQDMALIANRAFKLLKNDEKQSNLEKNFNDSESIDDYAKEAVLDMAGLGIINGYEDGTFRPHGYCTRAEAAKIIYGLCLIG